MHNLGLYHEHTRKDRDTYINIMWQYVDQGNLEFVGDPRELASAKRARGVLGHGVGFGDGVRGGDREGKYVLEYCESALCGTEQFLTISSLWPHAEE
ncbi:hypothetical protein NDU88_008242 [Pleurodeles waltl]|uniref:Peptidase M12A domain-containing protein n=1 Tax=Pleurodeles waltl TaxID=8319 RepID=A0AAV7SUN3_PLEWA|nr:hypothetical protein NDU88_008242 [Pleurodeles waltl]